MINLNDTQLKIYNLVKETATPSYTFGTLAELVKSFPIEFGGLSLGEFESIYKNNEVAVIRKLFPKETLGFSDADVIKFKPRGNLPICGQEEYLKYARLIGNNLIFTSPEVIDQDSALLDQIVQMKVQQATKSLSGSLNPNLVSMVVDAVGSIKQQLIESVKKYVGVVDKSPIKTQTPTVSPTSISGRDSVFEEEKITDQETIPEEMKKNPHKIKAFGEPRNTAAPQYPHNQIHMTEGGHIMEMDDTPESPRIRLQHINGSGIQVNGDGHFIRKTTYDNYDIHDEDTYKYVKGFTTDVHNKKVMKKYNDGIYTTTTYTYTEASDRVHFQTPIVSYNEMMLGKNAIFSNNVIIKQKATIRNVKVEEKITSPNAVIDNLKVDTNITSPKGTIKTFKGSWANTLAREAQVAWDIGMCSADEYEPDQPTRESGVGDGTHPMINKSLQFKEGPTNNPTFIKPVTMDHPVSFGQTSTSVPTTGAPNSITVHNGVLYVAGVNGNFAPVNSSGQSGGGN